MAGRETSGGTEEMSDEGLDALIDAMEHLRKPDEEEKSFEEKLAVISYGNLILNGVDTPK